PAPAVLRRRARRSVRPTAARGRAWPARPPARPAAFPLRSCETDRGQDRTLPSRTPPAPLRCAGPARRTEAGTDAANTAFPPPASGGTAVIRRPAAHIRIEGAPPASAAAGRKDHPDATAAA